MTRPAPALLGLVLLLSSCSTSTPEPCSSAASCEAARTCAPVDEAQVRENTPPDLVRVAEAEADLTVVVTSSSGPAERVVVRAGEELLLDGLLPPGNDYCGHNPVFSWSYDLPQEPVTVRVAAAGQQTSVLVDAQAARQWVTVMTQDDFPLYVKVTAEAPAFG